MAFSASAWISSAVCLGLGIVIGTRFNDTPLPNPVPSASPVTMPMHDTGQSRNLAADEAVLTRAVREEIALQLQDFKLKMLEQIAAKQDSLRAAPDIPVEQQKDIFHKASSLMDEAIAVGELDAISARELVDYLHSLPIEQQTALRAKQMDAFNRGLISSPLSPEEIMAQGKNERP